MNAFYMFLVLFLVTSCSVSEKRNDRLQSRYDEMSKVVACLDLIIAEGGVIPGEEFPVQAIKLGEGLCELPDGVWYYRYGENGYGLYAYFWGRVSLRYISYDDGGNLRGWWIDDDSSGVWVKPRFDGSSISWDSSSVVFDE